MPTVRFSPSCSLLTPPPSPAPAQNRAGAWDVRNSTSWLVWEGVRVMNSALFRPPFHSVLFQLHFETDRWGLGGTVLGVGGGAVHEGWRWVAVGCCLPSAALALDLTPSLATPLLQV